MLRYRTFVKSPPAAGGVGAIFADETLHPVRVKTQHQPNIVFLGQFQNMVNMPRPLQVDAVITGILRNQRQIVPFQRQPQPCKVAAVFGISPEPVIIRKHVLAPLLNDFGIDTNIIGITFLLTQHLRICIIAARKERRIMRRFSLFVLSVVLCWGAPAGADRSGDHLVVSSAGGLKVVYDQATGSFEAWSGDVRFISQGKLRRAGGKTRSFEINRFTKGIEVSYDDGSKDSILISQGVPFIVFGSRYHNNTKEDITLNKVGSASVVTDFGVSLSGMKVLGCDGLTDGGKERTSFTFLSAADPATRKGIVAGWLTHRRGSGIVLSKAQGGKLGIEGRAEYGRLLIAPGQSANSETFVIGYFQDVLEGLEKYADAVAEMNNVRLNPVTSGYCTWYSSPHGGASDEVHMAEMAEFCEKELTKFGFEVLQIDDKWQISGRDFTTHRANGPFSKGMKPTAEKITGAGMSAGIWYIPFGWDHTRDIFKDHQDWFVKTEGGEPYKVHWAGTCLDMTHPQAREFLSQVVARMSKEWGYKYMKIDGLWTGLAAKITYPTPVYREDNLGDAVFHNPAKTNLEAYRDGLKLVRRAAGDDVFILGCNIAQNMRTLGASFGLIDGMRVGRDIGANWGRILPCVEMGSRLYFLHSRVWYNDPDCLMLRNPLTLDQARSWGSWIAVTGQLNLVSEWLPSLPTERLDIVKRSMPNHGLCARPIDLFESNHPKIWQLTDTRTNIRRDVIALFNWDAKQTQKITVNLDQLDLPPSATGKYVGYEYWSQTFVGPFDDKIETEIERGACKVIAVRPMLDRPFLISTSRHITQGMVDVAEENWDATTLTLTGRSKVVADDSYELAFAMPGNKWSIKSNSWNMETSGDPVVKAVSGGVKLRSQWRDSSTVKWEVRFRKEGAE